MEDSEELGQISEQFCFASLNDMEALDQWMISTIQALIAYLDQKDMVARKTAVEAWNSRSVRSMVWRETLRAQTSISTKEATTDPASCIRHKSIPPRREWI